MLVEWMFEHNIFIALAIIFAISQMYLCLRHKQFQKNSNKNYNKIFTLNCCIFLSIIVLVFTVDLVKCFIAFIKVTQKNYPTAYDLDEVVEQLKKRSEEYNSGVRLHGKPEEMITTEAIEIVKGGGVDAKTDS